MAGPQGRRGAGVASAPRLRGPVVAPFPLLYFLHMTGTLGNWVDLALLAFLIYYLRDGYLRGGVMASFDLAGLALAITGALLSYGAVGKVLATEFGLALPFAKAAAFIIVWGVIEFLYPLAADRLYVLVPAKLRGSRGMKWAGLLPAFVQGVFMAALVLSLIVALPFPGAIKGGVLGSRYGSMLVSHADALQTALGDALGGAAKGTLSFLTVKEGSTETIDLGFHTGSFTPDPVDESRMLVLLNDERTSRGLPPLRLDDTLVPVARAHGEDMLRRGYFSHVTPEGKTPSDRAQAAGIQFTAFGENIAYAPDLTLAHAGLMNSPGHRANILSTEWDRVGIGVIDAGVYGKMFVQDFAN